MIHTYLGNERFITFNNQYMVKVIICIFLISALVVSIPYEDQICLANSLIVGKDDMSDLKNWECKVCDQSNKPLHTHFIENKSLDVKCIISIYADFIVLAFRYTNTALNVWEDILYPIQIRQETSCENCKVQKQFFKMWTTIREEVISDMNELHQHFKFETLHITGISLGGGLATIAYMDIAQFTNFNYLKVTTFGAPRVGNKYWAQFYDLRTLGKTKRYMVDGDPIPSMPRCITLLCTYRQVGVKIVCYESLNKCVQEQQIPDDDDQITFKKIVNTGRKALGLKTIEKVDEIGSIVDHIEGYPKIYNHTLIEN